jgi:CHAT domain-containing protein
MRRGAVLGLALIGAMAGSAARASVSESLCRPGVASTGAYPSSEALTAATQTAERRLATRGGSDALSDLAPVLEPASSANARPDAATLAAYCAAAGEFMRLSPQGSQLQAQTYLLSAFQLARSANLSGEASVAAYRLGLVSVSAPAASGARGARGQRGASSEVAREAVRAASGGACDVLLSPAALFGSNLSLSLASLGCSAEQAALAGDARTEALARLRLARLSLSVADTDSESAVRYRTRALSDARAGLAAAANVTAADLRAELLGRLALAALDAGATPGEIESLPAAILAAQSEAPAARALAAGVEARLALIAGDLAGATAGFEAALLAEHQRSLPARAPEWRLWLAQADPLNREAHIRAAYDALEAVRPLLPRFDPLTEETAFSLHMRRVFQAAVDLELTQAEGAAQVIRVAGAQRIVEAYRQAELQSVFGSECIPARDPVRPEALAPGEVLLYPILLPDRLELLYVAGGTGDGAFRRLPPNRSADRRAMTRLVEQAVLALSDPEGSGWREASRELYDLLIKPIEGELRLGGVLAVVPDGPLRALPFSVLVDSEGRYLVQKSRVTVAPSLAYAQPGGGGSAGQQLVAASLEMEVDLPAGSFERLEGTGAEARTAAVVDGARIERSWVIENFRKADLIQALTRERVDVLHLATHASFNGRSDRAFIVANGEAILLSELRGILAQNRTRGDDLALLVLSACETAVGDDEASMGLAGAAVQAGARSAIASLWPVNDAGTAELMTAFYRFYRDGRPASAALRDAQLAMIERGGMVANPNIWAAFTLLGAWR